MKIPVKSCGAYEMRIIPLQSGNHLSIVGVNSSLRFRYLSEFGN
jgi:hypothetical protein